MSLAAIGSTAQRISFAQAKLSSDALAAAAGVLKSGWLTTGPEVEEFEREFAAWVEARYAVAVSSCTAALEISLRALNLEPGAKVLTSTMTFCGAVHAIVHANLTPVLVDVNPDTLMPDPDTTAAAAKRAGGADAMVVLHFAGHPAPVEELARAASLSLDRVVEDAAHALGTVVGDRPVGAISAATCFSFYATKNLPIGEGGMLTTDDRALAENARRLRLHGMSQDAWRRYMPGASWRYEVDCDGLKANMTDLQAAIGRGQLRQFATWQAHRRHLARWYSERLSHVKGIKTPLWPMAGEHAWHLYVIQLLEAFPVGRDRLISHLAEIGIGCSVHFIPLHQQPYFQRLLGGGIGRFPAADSAFRGLISLPFHVGMEAEDVAVVCREIEALAEYAK